MPQYSAQFRNTILKKILPPENRSALSVAKEYHISVTTLYRWKARMKAGPLTLEEGIQSNWDRPLAEKLSLLLESRRIPEEAMGQWLREQGRYLSTNTEVLGLYASLHFSLQLRIAG